MGLSELGLSFAFYIPTMKTTYAAAAIITFLVELEQLFMAIDGFAIPRKYDHTASNIESWIKLFT